MLFFTLYAVAVWAGAMRWRRTWLGVGWVGLAIACMLGLGWLHLKLSDWTEGDIFLPILQALWYPYAIIVTIGGVLLFTFPRRPHVNGTCQACGYDLVGLRRHQCPECGGPVSLRRPTLLPAVRITKHGQYMSVEEYSAQQRASKKAQDEDQYRKPDDHREAQHAQ